MPVSLPTSHPDVSSLISRGSLRSVYQPIISLNQSRVIGFEALARATEADGKAIPSELLFREARAQAQALELDRFCRRKAIEGFRSSPVFDADTLIFINLDTTILNDRTVGSRQIRNLIEEQGLSPARVVIEILESQVTDNSAMKRFIDSHRKEGFLIALDDMGSGHSNLERIPSMSPDIIKLDRSLISNIDSDYQKQALFEFFIKLSGKLGAVVIAEGVETEAEAFACLERGADLFQGYFFARPGAIEGDTEEKGKKKAQEAMAAYRAHERDISEQQRQQYRAYEEIASAFCKEMRGCRDEDFDRLLELTIRNHPEVECAYILDDQGIQISSTVFSSRTFRRARSPLYAPARPGYDLSMREYFMNLDEWSTRSITAPYVSRATGSICTTISAMIADPCGQKRILCLDIGREADTGRMLGQKGI